MKYAKLGNTDITVSQICVGGMSFGKVVEGGHQWTLNLLHVGDMTGQQALDLHLTSAVSFSPGPVLVKDGKMRTDLGGGMPPAPALGRLPTAPFYSREQ